MVEQMDKKAVVMIPTYNERENIADLIQEILSLKLDLSISVLVADDNSPDGTGEIVRQLASKDDRIQVLIRTKRRGRGTGGIDGFKEALGIPGCSQQRMLVLQFRR